MDTSGIKLIELNLYAEAYYSGAEYNEVVFITPQDYIEYFGSGQDSDAKTFEEYVKDKWDDRLIYVGELDGKHSEISGSVEVGFWDDERIREYWEQPDNDDDKLLYTMLDEANTSGESQVEIMKNIQKHVNEVVDSIGTKVTVKCKVPKDKVKELRAFVEQLNK